MKRVLALVIAILVSLPLIGYAHPGRTDKNGGHWVRKPYPGYEVGTYHYHNGGSSSSSAKSTSSYSEDTKRVQLRLIELGYDPGAADGIMGSKTVSAIKQFQSDNGLTPDGVVGYQTRQKLNL